MINFTLRQLRYFESLARHGHFGRAADACAVSQPALSVQIKELEENLGMVLFERTPRQVRLTAFGQKFAGKAQDVLRMVDELGDLARASRGRFTGQLRLGVIPTIAPYLLPEIFKNLADYRAELGIQVRETQTENLIEELNEGRLDAAIVALPISEPSITETPLFDEKFVFVRPRSDQELPIPDRKSLRDMKLLLLEEGHCFRDQALSFCDFKSAQPRESLDASSLSTLVQMVGAGIGVTLIPEMAVAVETRSASVSVTRFKSPEPSRMIGMIWRKTNPLAEQLLEISKIIRLSGQNLRERNHTITSTP